MILVTGATGMLGSYLMLDLLKTEPKVRAIKRDTSSTKYLEKLFRYYLTENNYKTYLSKIEWVNGDVLDIYSLNDAMAGVKKVYHTAAVVSFNQADKTELIKTNVEGTANVVNCCLKNNIEKLCHVSSIAALGKAIDNEAIDEKTPMKPESNRSAYSHSKLYSEMEVWRGIYEGLNAVIINPSIILGAGNWNSGSPAFFEKVDKGLNFYTNGITGFVDARDVSKAAVQLMNSEISNERFVVSAENLSYYQLFTLIAKSLEKKPPKNLATPFLTEIAWRADWLRSKLLLSKHLITKQNMRSAHNQSRYSSQKLIDALNFTFTTIENCTGEVAKIYKKDNLLIK